MQLTFFRRFGPLICILALLVWPVLLYGVKGALESNSNNVVDWLPSSFEETQRLFWFVERFGSDEILVVSWPGCTLGDERLDHLASGLQKPLEVPGLARSEVLFREVFTGRNTLERFMSEPLSLSRPAALHRMKGWLVGPDGETTCAVALVSDAGMANRTAALQAVYQVAASCGLPQEQLHIGGPTADSVAIDRASQKWIIPLTFLSVCWGMLVAWWCLRSVRLVASVFFCASFAWSLSLAAVFYSGTNMDAVLLMMPGLVFVLGVSGAVHLTNYYTCAARDENVENPTSWAISHGWLPCVLACGTTAIGLGSLAVSHVKPIGKFGVYSAIGVIAVMVTLLTLWPAATEWWSRGVTHRQRSAKRLPSNGARRCWWNPLFHLATNRSNALLLISALALPALGYGVARIRTSAQLEDLLPPRSRLIQSYTWLQSHIGPLVPVEVVLQFERNADGNPLETLARAQLVEGLRRRIQSLDHTGGTTAATTFLKGGSRGGGAGQIIQKRVVAGRIQKHRDSLVKLRYIHDEPDAELWRVSTRVEALTGIDYGKFLERLQHEVDTYLAAQRKRTDIDVSARISGAVPLIYMAQEQLLLDLIKSFVAAFLLIAVVMVVLMRGIGAGLVSMIPNVLPAAAVFGTMGLMGTRVDIGAMMTASAALGIAVDDTLHFLVWFRRGLAQASTRREAIWFAYHHCATPMLQTSAICGLGLLVFALSPFTPTSHFAWLMAILLLLALVADLIVLPALLAGPLGSLFESTGQKADVAKRTVIDEMVEPQVVQDC
jgi:predicted RND superfamily exporter protein